MAESNHSESIQELMAGYALGDLNPEEAEDLQRLIRDRPELVGELHQLQETLAAMPYALPEVALPEAVRRTVLQVVQRGVQPTQINRRRAAMVAWGSIAAVVALVVGFDNYHLRQQLSTTQAQVAYQKDLIAMLQDPQTQVVTLKGMDAMARAAGNAVITPGHSEAILVLQDLPTPPRGKSYQLWVVTNGKKIACGQFTATPQGKVFVKVPFSFNTTSGMRGLVVTIETSPAPPYPQGPMVMTSSS